MENVKPVWVPVYSARVLVMHAVEQLATASQPVMADGVIYTEIQGKRFRITVEDDES